MKYSVENFVYGAIDGAVTTFAIVTGVIGASLSPSIIIILGFANLLADGFSMAIGNYLAVKTQNEFIQRERKREEWEIDNRIEEEKQEIREIYSKKGFKDELLDEIVRIITSRKKVWVDTAPLVGSSQPTGELVEVYILHESARDRQLYVRPPMGTPLYISRAWVRPAPKRSNP